jgi:hypothetical protein
MLLNTSRKCCPCSTADGNQERLQIGEIKELLLVLDGVIEMDGSMLYL